MVNPERVQAFAVWDVFMRYVCKRERECMCVSNLKLPSSEKNEYFNEYNPFPPIITPGLPTITGRQGASESLTCSFGGIGTL